MQHQRLLARFSGLAFRRQSLPLDHRLTNHRGTQGPIGLAVVLGMLLALGSLAGDAQAQSPYDFTIGVMGGIGGATDAEPDSGLTNLGLQVLFGIKKDNNTRFSIRAGTMELDDDGAVGLFGAVDTNLTYLTLSGEYLYTEPSYESGIFVGLGLYEVSDGLEFDGTTFRSFDESTVGLTLGASGDFQIGDHWSVLGELSGHYADLDYARFFVMAHVGFGFHF